MHDPMTVAFKIPNPFLPRYDWGERWSQRPSLITIWHVDPEKDGTDNSCWKRRPRGREKALFEAIRESIWDLETVIGNGPVFGSDLYPDIADQGPLGTPFEKLRNIQAAWLYKPGRPWRWHVWHWRFQIHPLQNFKRWAFSRCEKCGKRFGWGESPVSGQWSGTGPLWFRSEKHVRHGSAPVAASG